jgi:hypothetical protein
MNMSLIRSGTMLGRSINSLKKCELIREVKKLQNELSVITEENTFADIDYIKKINKLEEENHNLQLKLKKVLEIIDI